MSDANDSSVVSNGYKWTEKGIIPWDWDYVCIGDIAKVKGGKRLPSGFVLVDTPTPHPYVRVTDMYPGGVNQSEIKYVPEQAFPAIQNYRIYSEDIFISVAGTLGIVGVVPPELSGANLTENADYITDLQCNRDYLKYCLMSQPIQKTIQLMQTTGAQPKLALGRIAKFVISIPRDIGEQRAIAEVLSDVDGLIGALDALIAKKRAIKQATMQQLLTGRTRLPGFNGEWETKQIGDVVSLCSEKNNLGTDIPVLTCSKHLGFVDSLIYFKNQVFSKDLSSYKIIRHGQIGYPINHVEEGSIGLQDLYDVALVSPIYVVCSPKECINSFFLHRLLKLDSYRQQFANATTSSINRRGSLRWPAFSKIRVTLPPIAEQVAIATVLSDMETAIATLENRLDKTRDIKQGMMQQLLTGRVRLVRPDVGPQCDYTIKS